MVSTVATIIIVIAALMIISTARQYAKKRVPLSWLAFWSGLWIAGSLIVIFSGYASALSTQFLGMQANLVVLYFISILLLILSFRLYVSLKKTQADISRLVEEIAKKK